MGSPGTTSLRSSTAASASTCSSASGSGLNDPAPPLAPDLDGVFSQLREEAGRRPLLETAEHDLKRGQVLFQCGQFEECLAPLQSASRVPRLRFESTAA